MLFYLGKIGKTRNSLWLSDQLTFLFQALIHVMSGLSPLGSTPTLQTVHGVLLRRTRGIGLSDLLRWTTPMPRSTWLSTGVVRMSSVTNATLWARTPCTACSVAWCLRPALPMTGDSPTIRHGSSWFRSSPTSTSIRIISSKSAVTRVSSPLPTTLIWTANSRKPSLMCLWTRLHVDPGIMTYMHSLFPGPAAWPIRRGLVC